MKHAIKPTVVADTDCPVCQKAEALGYNEEQTQAFHDLVDAEIEVQNALSDLMDAGVEPNEEMEEHVDQILEILALRSEVEHAKDHPLH